LLVHMDSWACVCMCLHKPRAGCVSSYVGRYQKNSMFQHVSARIKSRACSSMCLPRAQWVSSCVGLYQELSVSAKNVLCLLRAAQVPACVGSYWGLHVI
jgi:hypothetical protein